MISDLESVSSYDHEEPLHSYDIEETNLWIYSDRVVLNHSEGSTFEDDLSTHFFLDLLIVDTSNEIDCKSYYTLTLVTEEST